MAAEGIVNLAGKVAIITGASSGIGWSTALLFAKLGARLSLAGRDSTRLDAVREACRRESPSPEDEINLTVGDLTNTGIAESLVESTTKKFGKIDILVNCAGIIGNGTIEQTTLEQYDTMFAVNVRSAYHLMMLTVPHLVLSKGNVVNVSSVCGMRSFPNVLAYCMSKSAIDQLTACTALAPALLSRSFRSAVACRRRTMQRSWSTASLRTPWAGPEIPTRWPRSSRS
ncbi:uncharacterized oxidoreductase SSP0419 isoform X2 [Ixodes scapularis]|uniref:uncharacterized oxidoreductase SSP0419 isoform X2 n=1 Tax=Ixodes scapularis TaxID=6945 RepID=UPI001A9D02DC|nr:uncharacterized oxidoreductase SSP0419 isoform X2 [Ixodes scapularis]